MNSLQDHLPPSYKYHHGALLGNVYYPCLRIDGSDYWSRRSLFHGFVGHFVVPIFSIFAVFFGFFFGFRRGRESPGKPRRCRECPGETRISGDSSGEFQGALESYGELWRALESLGSSGEPPDLTWVDLNWLKLT